MEPNTWAISTWLLTLAQKAPTLLDAAPSRARDEIMTRDIQKIIDKGLGVIDDMLDHFKMASPDDYDTRFAKAVTTCTLAAVEIAREERDAASFLAKQQLDEGALAKLLQDYLAKMPPAQFAELVAQVGDARTPPEKRT